MNCFLNSNKATKDWEFLVVPDTVGTITIPDISLYSELLFVFTFGSDQIIESVVITRGYFCANTNRQVIMHDSRNSQAGIVQYLSNTSVSFSTSHANWTIRLYGR